MRWRGRIWTRFSLTFFVRFAHGSRPEFADLVMVGGKFRLRVLWLDAYPLSKASWTLRSLCDDDKYLICEISKALRISTRVGENKIGLVAPRLEFLSHCVSFAYRIQGEYLYKSA